MALTKDSDIPINAAIAVSRDAGGNAFDCAASSIHQVTASGGNILAGFNNLKPGQRLTFRFIQDGVGGRTLAIANPMVRMTSGLTITPTPGAGEETYYSFVYDGSLLLLVGKV